MENFIIDNAPDIQYSRAPIKFTGYEYYKSRAEELAEYVKTIEVTEDTVKAVKSQLAEVRKVTDGLNKKRIEIKKEILSDYDVFEGQIKEISGIISSADETVRSKVRELEEIERAEKEEKIHEIWNARKVFYDFTNYVDAYPMWLTPQHLNKTVSMKSVEADMTDWLEEKQSGWDAAAKMGIEYQTEYSSTLNLSEAIQAVNNREAMTQRISDFGDNKEIAAFIITGAKDIKLAEMLLKENNINFVRR